MSFLLTEEQESIRKTARAIATERLPVGHLRHLRDTADAQGFSREAWREMAELGLVGIPFPEAYGGTGLGFAELGLVLEELGRSLAPTPFLSTCVLAGGALLLGGTEAQKQEMLPPLCAGERVLALAHEEGTRHAPSRVATRAEVIDHGFRLTGEKVFVLDGHVADAFVVVARTSGVVARTTGAEADTGGLSLFLVPRNATGVSVVRTTLVDSRNAARVRFDGVPVGAEALLGTLGGGAALLDRVLDRGRVVLAAEMLGGIHEAFSRTLAYLKERRQFGVPIGSFQALKHRAAHMFCEIELAKSIVMDALRAVDEGRSDLAEVASIAKARATDTFLLVANEAVQMHGGVGVTDELDIGFFLKRARVAEMTLGDAAFHRDRFARLSGY